MGNEQPFDSPPPSIPPKSPPGRPRYHTEPNRIIEPEPITQVTPVVRPVSAAPIATPANSPAHAPTEKSGLWARLSRKRKKLLIATSLVCVFFLAGIFSAFWFTSSATAGGKSVYAWGQGLYGQLGNARTQEDFDDPWAREFSPVRSDTAGMFSGHQIVQVAAGGGHSLALTETGTIYAWGHGAQGQLGNGQDYSQLANDVMPGAITAVAVDGSGALAGKEIVQIAAGGGHSLALDSEGQVYAWGYGGNGQLGNGEFEDALEPVPVDTSGAMAGRKVIAISTLADHSLALAADGTVFAWGRGNLGQLGNGEFEDSALPVAVTGELAGKNIVEVAAGGHHSLAADADGNIYAWGSDEFGQLGDGIPDPDAQPEPEDSHKAPEAQPVSGKSADPVVVNLSDAPTEKELLHIAAGGEHSVALWSNSDIYQWGSQILSPDLLQTAQDDDDFTNHTPAKVQATAALGNEKLIEIAAGWSHNVVLSEKGRVYSWGAGWLGQMGTGEAYGDPFIAVETPFGARTPVPSFGSNTDERVAVAISAGQNHTLVIGRD